MARVAVDEYRDRKARWAARHAALTRRDRTIANARLMLFGVAVLVMVFAVRGTISGWWLILPVGAFIPLLRQHDAVIRQRLDAARLVGYYEQGLARLDDRWSGNGDGGDRFLDEDHLFAADLDLFGRGSLFELLSLARTRSGEATLAGWLKGPAAPDVIRARHAAVEELRRALDLRESLSLAGGHIGSSVQPGAMAAWATAPPPAASSRRAIAAALLTATLIALVIAWWFSGWISLLVLAATLRAIYQRVDGARVEAALRRADAAARTLDVLRPALHLLEGESFGTPALVALQDGLHATRVLASTAIATLVRYAEMHDWTHNIVFTPIAALLMWDAHLAWAVERWRARYGRHVDEWLRIVGEFEALASIAAYAYEHPQDPFPEIVDPPREPPAGAAVFAAESLGHPLLPAAQMVPNDVGFDGGTQLLVVSGSNMSGKSTLLRTVGINAVLALAGAPVRASRLRISPVAIGATLRIQDSLQQGRSRFFAEITRVRQIADRAATEPVLFLLDELFHGTNSHDRLVGATGVLRTLLDRGAIGLITTHDLALTAIVRDLGSRAANVHFEDSFDGVDMHFDYRIKNGPVTRSNAIALMRAVGLDVGEDPT